MTRRSGPTARRSYGLFYVSLLFGLTGVGCKVDVPSGSFSCPDGRCPSGQTCHSDGICRSTREPRRPKDSGTEPEAGAEAGPIDAADSGDHNPTTSEGGIDGGMTMPPTAPAEAGTNPPTTPTSNTPSPSPDGGSGTGTTTSSIEGGATEAPFEVLTISPASDTTLDDTLATISVKFSRTVRSDTVNENSFFIARSTSSETPVAGSIAVSGDIVTFSPDLPWALAGTYAVRLRPDIVDTLGRPLTERSSSFTIREGKWTSRRFADANFFSDAPDVSMSANGNAVLAWYAQRDAMRTAPTIWASRYSPGRDWTAGAPLDVYGPTFRVQTAISNRGHAVVAWDYADGVFASTYTAGSTWNPRLTLDAAAYNPGVAITEDDIVYAALGLAHQTSYTTGIRFMAGASAITPSDVHDVQASTPDVSGGTPVLAMLGGLPQVLWIQTVDMTPASIWWNAFSTSVCDTCRKQLSNGGAADHARIASDSAQTAAIAVWQQNDVGQSNVAATRIVAGGQWSMPTVLSDRAGAASEPAVAVDSTGHGIVVWQQQVASGSRILASLFTAGEGYSKSEIVSAAVNDIVSKPVVALEAGGNAIAAWNAQSSTSTSVNDVWAARYVAGKGWLPAARLKLSQTSAVEATASAAIDDSGRAFVAWMEQDSVWIARFE